MDCPRYVRAHSVSNQMVLIRGASLRTVCSAAGHPPQTKKAALADCRNLNKKNGGGGWIRTIEGMAGRFTVYCI